MAFSDFLIHQCDRDFVPMSGKFPSVAVLVDFFWLRTAEQKQGYHTLSMNVAERRQEEWILRREPEEELKNFIQQMTGRDERMRKLPQEVDTLA